MTISRIRSGDPGGTHWVVLAANEAGRMEPFILEREEDARYLADNLDGTGAINIVLIYGPLTIIDPDRVHRLGLKARLRLVGSDE